MFNEMPKDIIFSDPEGCAKRALQPIMFHLYKEGACVVP